MPSSLPQASLSPVRDLALDITTRLAANAEQAEGATAGTEG